MAEKIEFVIQGIDRGSATLSKVAGGVIALNQALQLTKAVAGTVDRAIRAVLVPIAIFEKDMNRVKALSAATAGQFRALEIQARKMGATTQFSASEAAQGMGFLAQAGFKTNKIIAAMPSTLNLAAAAQLDLATSADIVSNVMQGYGLDAKNTAKAVDVLTKAFTSSNTDLRQLGEAMKFAGPVAKGFGLTFEETAAALGLMGNAGIQASMAGTGLRGALVRLANPSKTAAKILKELGVNVFDAKGKMVSLNEIIQQLETSGASTAQIMEIFGQRAGPAMKVLIDQGSAALRAFTRELERSGGTAEKIAKIQMEGLAGETKIFKSVWQELLLTIGDTGALDAAVSIVINLAEAIGAVTRGIKDWNDIVFDAEDLKREIKEVTAQLDDMVQRRKLEIETGGSFGFVEGMIKKLGATLKRLTDQMNATIGSVLEKEVQAAEGARRLRKAIAGVKSELSDATFGDSVNRFFGITIGIHERKVKRLRATLKALEEQLTAVVTPSRKNVGFSGEDQGIAIAEAAKLARGRNIALAKIDADRRQDAKDHLEKLAADRLTAFDERFAEMGKAASVDGFLRQRFMADGIASAKAADAERLAARKLAFAIDQQTLQTHLAQGLASGNAADAERLAARKLAFSIDQQTFQTHLAEGLASAKLATEERLSNTKRVKDEELSSQKLWNETVRAEAVVHELLMAEQVKLARDLAFEGLVSNFERRRFLEEEQFQKRMEIAKGNQELELAVIKAHEKAKSDAEKREQNFRLAQAATALGQFAALARVAGRRSFGVYKALAISQAIISTYLAASKAFATGGGWPFGAILAAASIAFGLAQVAQIKRQRPAAHGGLDNVPAEQTFLLDKGERVLSPRQNRDLTGFLEGQRGGSGGGGAGGGNTIVIEKMSILENVTTFDSFMRMDERDLRELVATRIIGAFDDLDRAGVRPAFAQRGRDGR